MALATTCPQCKTSFKVVPDQLKLRRGLVRCGVCQHVFSGIDYLRYVDDAARAAQRLARERAAAGQTAAGGAVPNGGAGGAAAGAAGAATSAPRQPVSQPPLPQPPLSQQPLSQPTAAAGTSGTPGGAPGGSTIDAPAVPAPASLGAASPMHDGVSRGPDAPLAPDGSFGGMVTRAGGASGAFPHGDARGASPEALAAAPAEAPSPRTRPADTADPSNEAAFTSAAGTPQASVAASPSPTDPWAAAAHAAHERSLLAVPSDDALLTADPLRGAGSLAPGAFEPATGSGTPQATAPEVEPASLQVAPAHGPSVASEPAVPAPTASTDSAASTGIAAPVPAPTAPVPAVAASAAPTAAPAGYPALPAPGAQRTAAASLDDLLARPTVPWPTASGPQTIISGDEDLKTAFFLPDSAFGPLPAEDAQSGPRTLMAPASRADAVDPDPITRLRPEARPPRPDDDVASDLALRPARGFFDEATIDAPMTEVAGTTSRREARSPERAIDYFPGVRNRSRGIGLALSPSAWVAASALTLLLVLQSVVGWRDAIAARAPWVAPVLGAVLSPFGAEIAPPREIDALTIEGFELQPAGSPNVLQLSAVLRNRSGHVVGYPSMELTLTDSVGALLVRKVIPVDAWLPDPAARAAGIAGGTERPLRLALEHNGLQPTGYAVALFYP